MKARMEQTKKDAFMTDSMLSQRSLIQQCITIVRNKKSLLIFPTASTILMIATYFIGFIPLIHIEAASVHNQGHVSGKTYLIFIGILILVFSIIGLGTLLFHAGLTVCGLKHLQQEPYTIELGFKAMLKYFGTIFLIKGFYDAMAIYVKFMRYWVDDWSKTPISMNLTSGLPWSDAVLLILPVLVTENTTFLQTLRRSAQLIKNKWGADVTLRGDFFSHILSVISFLSFIPAIVGVIIGGSTAITIGVTITVILTTVKTIIHSTTQVILSCALYLYATEVDISDFFDAELLKKAFRPLTKKELHAS